MVLPYVLMRRDSSFGDEIDLVSRERFWRFTSARWLCRRKRSEWEPWNAGRGSAVVLICVVHRKCIFTACKLTQMHTDITYYTGHATDVQLCQLRRIQKAIDKICGNAELGKRRVMMYGMMTAGSEKVFLNGFRWKRVR